MNILAIARNELRCRLRSEPLQLSLAATVAISALATALMIWAASSIRTSAPTFAPTTTTLPGTTGINYAIASQRGEFHFVVLASGLVILACIIAPLAATATLNRERDSFTFEASLMFGISPLTLLAGKLLAATTRSLVIVGSAAPFLATAWLFEGAGPRLVVTLTLTVIAVLVLGSAAGLLMAALIRGNVTALLASYTFLAVAFMVGPSVAMTASWLSSLTDRLVTATALYVNPFTIMFVSEGDLLSTLAVVLPLKLPTLALSQTDRWLGLPVHDVLLAAVSAWYLVLAALVMVVASAALDPLHPLRTLRQRARP